MLLPGGKVVGNSDSTEGELTVMQLSQINFDVMVASCGGIDGDSVTEASQGQCAIKQTVLKTASKKILLADERKFGARCPYRTCGIGEFDIVITNRRPLDIYGKLLSQLGCKLIY